MLTTRVRIGRQEVGVYRSGFVEKSESNSGQRAAKQQALRARRLFDQYSHESRCLGSRLQTRAQVRLPVLSSRESASDFWAHDDRCILAMAINFPRVWKRAAAAHFADRRRERLILLFCRRDKFPTWPRATFGIGRVEWRGSSQG